jgi:predicted sulfurtransferase
MTDIINISGYKFTPLEKIATLRVDLRKRAEDLDIMGTILLSHEGINLSLAGKQEAIDTYVEFIKQDDRFGDIDFKKSVSDFVPFSKMIIKLKKEIVSMGVEGVKSPSKPANALAPKELKRWYDEGKDFTIIDTRNTYEFKIGTFKNAKLLPLENFRQFPDIMRNKSEKEKAEPIVMFCTGGVRCEKAMPFLQEQGFKNIFQLHGGIIKYFEECGGEHYDGECFVFDDRVAIGADLKVTGSQLCKNCQMPVTVSEQAQCDFEKLKMCCECSREAVK